MKVGFINYLNSFPLFQNFSQANLEVIFENPRIVSEMLVTKRLDAGQISLFQYLKQKDKLECLEQFCIASKESKIQSVLLFSEYPKVEQIKNNTEIFITSHSTTSFNLLKVLLEKFYKLKPRYIYSEIEDLKLEELKQLRNFLVIGDLSFSLEKKIKDLYQFDLAKLWYKETALPFVFAVFVKQREFQEKIFVNFQEELAENLKRNLSDRKSLALKASKRANSLRLSAKEIENYFSLISYSLDSEHQKSIKLFESLII